MCVMQILEVRYSRRFNLGNYESEEIGLSAQLEDGDNLDEVFKTLKGQVMRLHEMRFLEKLESVRLAEAIEGYPWNQFKNSEGEWVFADKAPELRVELEKHDGRMELAGYVYRFPAKGEARE
ncbi:MAG: hypothetical protein ACTSXC_00925 [Candidatus Freyarchaeota archaeon]